MFNQTSAVMSTLNVWLNLLKTISITSHIMSYYIFERNLKETEADCTVNATITFSCILLLYIY